MTAAQRIMYFEALRQLKEGAPKKEPKRLRGKAKERFYNAIGGRNGDKEEAEL